MSLSLLTPLFVCRRENQRFRGLVHLEVETLVLSFINERYTHNGPAYIVVLVPPPFCTGIRVDGGFSVSRRDSGSHRPRDLRRGSELLVHRVILTSVWTLVPPDSVLNFFPLPPPLEKIGRLLL